MIHDIDFNLFGQYDKPLKTLAEMGVSYETAKGVIRSAEVLAEFNNSMPRKKLC